MVKVNKKELYVVLKDRVMKFDPEKEFALQEVAKLDSSVLNVAVCENRLFVLTADNTVRDVLSDEPKDINKALDLYDEQTVLISAHGSILYCFKSSMAIAVNVTNSKIHFSCELNHSNFYL